MFLDNTLLNSTLNPRPLLTNLPDHPKKLKPPAQVQLYVGFLFDTTHHPRLGVPQDKLDRARAMVPYVKDFPVDLSLALPWR